MSLLTIIQDVCDLLSLARPLLVANSTDSQVRTLFALAKEEGEELRKGGDNGHEWQALIEESAFTTVAAAAQPAALPSDFDHFIPNSFFNRTTMRELIGPITPQAWQAVQAQPAVLQVYLAFRERQGRFLVTPNPPAGQVIAFEYLSKSWVQPAPPSTPTNPGVQLFAPSTGSGSTLPAPTLTWNADSDTALLDEHLIKLGVRWRFLKSKGLDYSEDFTTYQRQVEIAQARDGTARTLMLSGPHASAIRGYVPEGNFPGPSG